MTFIIDLQEQPEPLAVSAGDGQEFTIIYRFMDTKERSTAVEFLSSVGLTSAWEIIRKTILAWEGVQNPQKAPIPYKVTNHEGVENTANLDLVFGRIPFNSLLMVICKIFAVNGVRFGRIREAVAPFMDSPEQLKAWQEELDRFQKGRQSKAPASESFASSAGGNVSGK